MILMCRSRLIRRFPARDSRCRTWSPENASISAVPFQDAKWPRSGNLVMSATSTIQPADRLEDVEDTAAFSIQQTWRSPRGRVPEVVGRYGASALSRVMPGRRS